MKGVYSTSLCMFGIPLDGGYDFQMRVKKWPCVDQVDARELPALSLFKKDPIHGDGGPLGYLDLARPLR